MVTINVEKKNRTYTNKNETADVLFMQLWFMYSHYVTNLSLYLLTDTQSIKHNASTDVFINVKVCMNGKNSTNCIIFWFLPVHPSLVSTCAPISGF